MIESELFQQLYVLLDGARISGRAECAERMMIGYTLEKHLLAIELEPEIGRKLYGSNAEAFGHLVGHRAIGLYKRHLSRVQVRIVAIPQHHVVHGYAVELELPYVLSRMLPMSLGGVIYLLAVRIRQPDGCAYAVGLEKSGQLGLYHHRPTPLRNLGGSYP